MTLIEFLVARLDEDEALATRVVLLDEEGELTGRYMLTLRVLNDIEVKRRIIERHAPYDDIQVRRQTRTLAGDTLRLLAFPYAEHPDYREEWKP